MSAHVIAIGEPLVEIMRPEDGAPLDQEGVFHGPYPSGAPAIFAVAAARLGMQVGFIGCVGRDAFGRLMQKRLGDEGVDLSQMQVRPDHATGAAFIAYAPDGSREFVFHLRHSAAGALESSWLSPDYFLGVDWLHISGSFLALSEETRSACQFAMDCTLSAGGKISFDPNIRPELMPIQEARDVFAPYLQACHLLLPTESEALALASVADENAAAEILLGDSDRLVVFKRGAAGSSFFSKDGRLEMPGYSVDEVDPTGAGDCFNAGCVLGLSEGWPLEQVARFSNAAGALAVTKQGPMEGAPTPAEVERLINSYE